MKGMHLQFYMSEFEKHHGKILYEWILELAKKSEVEGGSVFKTIAGFGKQGKLHEEHFFELGSESPVKVEFFLSEAKAKALIDLLKKDHPDLFYSITSAEFGTLSDKN